ncbi:MAG: hypothetical protein U0Y82_17185 [Thermoleophilia bacterium]
MDIGREIRRITVEPLWLPVAGDGPDREPEPAPPGTEAVAA